MKFDVVIGNPPYHQNDGGYGRSARPIYQHFVQQAKKLNPRCLVMIIPSRWFAGGKGLDKFRAEMLNDNRIRKLVDFEDATEVFPEVDIAGGVCYFLWERDSRGDCEVINLYKGKSVSSTRKLSEFPILIRHNQAMSIIRKVQSKKEQKMSQYIQGRGAFGLPTNTKMEELGDIVLRGRNGKGFYKRENISRNIEMIDKWKVITSKTSYDYAGRPGKDGKRRILSVVDLLPPGAACTGTFIVVGTFDSQEKAERLASYLRTRFIRFLIYLTSFSQDISKKSFYFVPVLDINESWTDEKLYQYYDLTEEEIDFIESKIRPM